MKTKLLKKLRKDALKGVWIEYWHWHDRFVIRDTKCDTETYCTYFKDKEGAIVELKRRRRRFIIDKIIEMRSNEIQKNKYRLDL